MANYHRLKTIDHVFRQRSVILDRLDAIERDDLAMDAAAGWYAMQRGSGKQQGRAAVQDDLLLLRAQFDVSSPHHRRHRRPEFSILGRCAAEDSIPQDRRTEGQLQFIVDAMAKGACPDFEFDV